MSASSRRGRALQDASLAAPRVWTRSTRGRADGMSRRFYAAPADATAAPPGVDVSGAPVGAGPVPQSPRRGPPPAYDVRSGFILTRPPLLTRRLHPFENAFFFYQKRLEQRLCAPFVTDVYFKPDTTRQLDWKLKLGERRGIVAKELGAYYGKGARAWDDELVVGDPLSRPETMVDSLLKDAEVRVSEDAEVLDPADVVPVERPRDRQTEADRTGDVRRLDRKLDRTLHLVVEGKDGWGFPADVVSKDENLHETAQRVMDQAVGVKMNTWMVGRAPIAHMITQPVVDADGAVQARGRKTFFLKARIMAGQANLKGNPFGYSDFKWLTAEELASQLEERYFHAVRNVMPLR